MASYYVWNGATGGGTGADWTNAFTRLNTAMTGRAAGDVFYVAHDHTETAAVATTYSSPGTEVAPCFVYCVDRAGSVPPVPADLRTTAQIITTAASNLTLAGMVRECNGIIFNAGTGAVTASVIVGLTLLTWRLVNCALRIPNTGGSSRVSIGVAGTYTVLENCTVQFGNIAQGISWIGRVTIRGPGTTSFITGATIPTNLFLPPSTAGHLFMEGVDLSAMATTSKNLFINTSTPSHIAVLKDCKLGVAGDVMAAGTIVGTGALEVTLIRCDDDDTNYRSEKYNRSGQQLTETLVVRSGGATDGTTPISYAIFADNPQSAPFECLPISFWNETVGSPVTVTLHAISDATVAGIRTNGQIWMEIEYLGTSGFPIGSRVSTGVASTLQSLTTYPASSETWGGVDGVHKEDDSRFYMSVTFTPQEKGPVTIYVMRGNIGSGGVTYLDPKPVVS